MNNFGEIRAVPCIELFPEEMVSYDKLLDPWVGRVFDDSSDKKPIQPWERSYYRILSLIGGLRDVVNGYCDFLENGEEETE